MPLEHTKSSHIAKLQSLVTNLGSYVFASLLGFLAKQTNAEQKALPLRW